MKEAMIQTRRSSPQDLQKSSISHGLIGKDRSRSQMRRIPNLVLLFTLFGALSLSQCTPTPLGETIDPSSNLIGGDPRTTEAEIVTSVNQLEPVDLSTDEKLRVVTTSNLVTDTISNIGGDAIELTGLLPRGVDPHSYELTTGDLQSIHDAHVVFINGAELEETILVTLANSGSEVPIVSLSEDLSLRTLGGPQSVDDHSEDHASGVDPHVWFDPTNVIGWSQTAQLALSSLDPENESIYQQNAQSYGDELKILDAWIMEQTSAIPEERRMLISDHESFGYLADRYGFQVVGAVIPSFSSSASVSAQELADLTDTLRDLDAKIILVSTTTNSALAESIATDTGAQVVSVYVGALSPPDGPAPTYIDLMRFDLQTIVEALR
jgi:ABC-type Zn uptake system ZnuABC Zn-binding protein ZnuA